MDLSVSPKDEIWFQRVWHHISNAVVPTDTVDHCLVLQALPLTVLVSAAVASKYDSCYLLTYLLTYLHTYILTYILTYLHTYLLTYLLT